MAYRGSCLCGNIHYQFTRFDNEIAHCHCRMCRKFHGAAFSTFVPVARTDLTWKTGAKCLATYQASNGTKRQFCVNCGSSLTFQSANDNNTLEIALATLDMDDSSLTPLPVPDAHVHVDSKVEWYTINDELPQYRKDRPT
ncbi:GFA family protein [Thalassotalea mangrovi]|uniref:GFA family protein n=1 Tax=Thalassotalea mangrovi TaxID=2572245 RepID=A0A4U1B705_9GAMM|nr:GFA family protein [Thalassotalea mangrovi]TKB46354.1 GFA family protein [Thalassotalea mangrovi]